MARQLVSGVYTVQHGDSMWDICNEFISQIRTVSGNPGISVNDAVKWVAAQNDRPGPPYYIYTGEKIAIKAKADIGPDDSSTSTKNATNSNAPVITYFGPVATAAEPGADPEKEIVAIWTWTKEHTAGYHYFWEYTTGLKEDDGDAIWFVGEEGDNTIDEEYESDSEHKNAARQSMYTFPDNATKIRFKVKATSRTYKSGEKDVHYWSGSYCAWKSYSANNIAPETPSAPTVEQTNRFTMKVTMENLDVAIKKVEVEIYENGTKLFTSGRATINAIRTATFSCNLGTGSTYAARVRVSNGHTWSNWSEFTDPESVKTVPDKQIFNVKILSTNTGQQRVSFVYVSWTRCWSADQYEIEWITPTDYRASGNQWNTSAQTFHEQLITAGEGAQLNPTSVDISTSEFSDPYQLNQWYIRFRVNVGDYGSDWSDVQTIVVGTQPNAPTTWSSSSTIIVRTDTCRLFWTHNATDNSVESKAQFDYCWKASLDDPDEWLETKVEIDNNRTGERQYALSEAQLIFTSREIPDARKHQSNSGPALIDMLSNWPEYDPEDPNEIPPKNILVWRMRTQGAIDQWSPWSTTRVLHVYKDAILTFGLYSEPGTALQTNLTAFPFYIQASCANQTAVAYYVHIDSKSSYDTVDDIGHVVHVSPKQTVFSRVYDQTELDYIEITPKDVTLFNSARYIAYCEVTTELGVVKSKSKTFTVAFDENGYFPNCEVGIDRRYLTASVRPYCEDENGDLIDDVYLSIYRREFDGSYTPIQVDIDAESLVTDSDQLLFVTDPHPSLDFARYRIISKDKTTGIIAYYDSPGVLVGETSIILQWNEEWQSFDITDNTNNEPQAYSGSFLKLPYNIDVSEDNDLDVATVNYIGREHPVSYYGTHLGTTASWSTDIPKSDKDTLYALRRLSRWMGDVYIREPSGVGYWATIKVSFSQKHLDLVIPVSISITRVEGGI